MSYPCPMHPSVIWTQLIFILMRHSFSIYFYLKRRKLQRQQVNNHAPHHSRQQGCRCKPEDFHLAGTLGQAEQTCFCHEPGSTRHQCISGQCKFHVTPLLPTGPTGRKAAYSKHAETTLHGNRIQSAFSPGRYLTNR